MSGQGLVQSLRIALCYWGRRGGVAKFALELAHALVAREDVSLVVSYSEQGEYAEQFRGLPCPLLPVRTFTSPQEALLRLSRSRQVVADVADALLHAGVDVVLVPGTHIWDLELLRRLRSAGVPYAFVVHDALLHPGERNPVLQRLLRTEIKSADALFTLSAHVARQLEAMHPRAIRTHRWVLPLPVHARMSERVRPAVRGGRVHLLHIGRQLPYQGPDLFIGALEELHRRGVAVDATMAGQGLSNALAAAAHRAGARTIRGWLTEDQVEHLVDGADIVVLPYREASQSGVVPLAYSFGVPVVATPVGGLIEQVHHEQTGLLTSDVSSAAIAGSIERLVGDYELYERCSTGAAEEARTVLAWPSVGALVVHHLRALVGAAGSRT